MCQISPSKSITLPFSGLTLLFILDALALGFTDDEIGLFSISASLAVWYCIDFILTRTRGVTVVCELNSKHTKMKFFAYRKGAVLATATFRVTDYNNCIWHTSFFELKKPLEEFLGQFSNEITANDCVRLVGFDRPGYGPLKEMISKLLQKQTRATYRAVE